MIVVLIVLYFLKLIQEDTRLKTEGIRIMDIAGMDWHEYNNVENEPIHQLERKKAMMLIIPTKLSCFPLAYLFFVLTA